MVVMIVNSRYLVYRVKDGLLEAVAESTDYLDGASNPHPHLFMLQGLVIGHIIWKLAGGNTCEEGSTQGRGGKEKETRGSRSYLHNSLSYGGVHFQLCMERLSCSHNMLEQIISIDKTFITPFNSPKVL